MKAVGQGISFDDFNCRIYRKNTIKNRASVAGEGLLKPKHLLHDKVQLVTICLWILERSLRTPGNRSIRTNQDGALLTDTPDLMPAEEGVTIVLTEADACNGNLDSRGLADLVSGSRPKGLAADASQDGEAVVPNDIPRRYQRQSRA